MQSSVLSMGCMCACSTMQSRAPGCAASTVAGCSVQLSALRVLCPDCEGCSNYSAEHCVQAQFEPFLLPYIKP